MCLLQNLAYEADNTSSVWTMNVIEKKKEKKKERKNWSDHLSNAIVWTNGYSINKTKEWPSRLEYKIKNRYIFLPMISF